MKFSTFQHAVGVTTCKVGLIPGTIRLAVKDDRVWVPREREVS